MNVKIYQRSLGQWLTGVCVALASLPVLAAPLEDAVVPALCPLKPVYPLPTDPASLEALKIQLDALEPVCLRSATFYAWRGALLLAQRQTATAIEALERALLLEPNLPGAQLDYIDALLNIGDIASAKGLIEQVAQRRDIPAHVRLLLERELAVINPGAWRIRWTLTTALGLDNNLNNASSASALTLTLPQGTVSLPLFESSRPQNGAASLSIVQWQGIKPQDGQLWLLEAELRARHTADPATRYQQADMSANWLQAPEAPSQWIVRTGLNRIDFGGRPLLQSARASLLHQRSGLQASLLSSVCRPSTGLELEYRRYRASPELNGRYTGLMGAINCNGTQSLGLQLRLGSDQPNSPARPGGYYRRAELRATWEAHYGLLKLNADYGYTRQLDSSGYSPLLSNNLARQARRHSLRVELVHPLSWEWLGGADGFVSVEVNRQTSNLAAFENRQTATYAGLRWSRP